MAKSLDAGISLRNLLVMCKKAFHILFPIGLQALHGQRDWNVMTDLLSQVKHAYESGNTHRKRICWLRTCHFHSHFFDCNHTLNSRQNSVFLCFGTADVKHLKPFNRTQSTAKWQNPDKIIFEFVSLVILMSCDRLKNLDKSKFSHWKNQNNTEPWLIEW